MTPFQSVGTVPFLSLSDPRIIFMRVAADFRHKFGALHQSYTPNKERELYSVYPLLPTYYTNTDVCDSSSDGGHRYATNGYDHTKRYV